MEPSNMSFFQAYQTHPQYVSQQQPVLQAQIPQQMQMQVQPQVQVMAQSQPQYYVQPQVQQLMQYQPAPSLWQPSAPVSQGPTTHPSRANWGGRGPMLRPRGGGPPRGAGRARQNGTPARTFAAPQVGQQQQQQQQPYQQYQQPPQQQYQQQPFQQPQQPQMYQGHPQPFQLQQPPTPHQPQHMQAQFDCQPVQPIQQQGYQQQPSQWQQAQQATISAQPMQPARFQQASGRAPLQQSLQIKQEHQHQVPYQSMPFDAPAAIPVPIAPTAAHQVWHARLSSGSPEPPLPGMVQAPASKPVTKVSLPGLNPARQCLSTGPGPTPVPEPEPEPEPLNIDWLNPEEEKDPLISAPTLIEHPARVWNGLLHGLPREMQPAVRWAFELGEGADPLTTAHLTLVLPPTHPAVRAHIDFATLPTSRYAPEYEPAMEQLGGMKNWTGMPRRLKLDAQNTTITLAISENALGWVENPFHKNLNTTQSTARQSQDELEFKGQTESPWVAAFNALAGSQQYSQPQQSTPSSGDSAIRPQIASAPSSVIRSNVEGARAFRQEAETTLVPSSMPTPGAAVVHDGMVKVEWAGGVENGGGEFWVPAAAINQLQLQATQLSSADENIARLEGPDAQELHADEHSIDLVSTPKLDAQMQQFASSVTEGSSPTNVSLLADQHALPSREKSNSPLDPVTAAVRAFASRTNIELIENNCLSAGKGGIEVVWKETFDDVTKLHGCELNINICPSVTRFFSSQRKHETPDAAKADCAAIAIRKEVLEFVTKYAKYATPKPKTLVPATLGAPSQPQEPHRTPPLVFTGGRFTLPSKPDPMAIVKTLEPARLKHNPPPPGQTWLDVLLEVLRVSIDPSQQSDALNFEPIIEDSGRHGCQLNVAVRGQTQSYLQEPTCDSMDEARDAVCARALELNVAGWMVWAEEAFKPALPAVKLPTAVATRSSNQASVESDAFSTIFNAVCTQGLMPEVQYIVDPFSHLYGASLTISLPGRDGVSFRVAPQYPHKAEARNAVSQVAVHQGVLEMINQSIPTPQQQAATEQSDSDHNTARNPSSPPVEVSELETAPISLQIRGKPAKFSKVKRGKFGRTKKAKTVTNTAQNPDHGWGNKKRKSVDAEWVNKLTAVCFQDDLDAPSFETVPVDNTHDLEQPLYRVAALIGRKRFFAPTSEPFTDIDEAKEYICRKACEQLSSSKRQRLQQPHVLVLPDS